MVTETSIGVAPPSGSRRAYAVLSAATVTEGGCPSKNTCRTALVPTCPEGLEAVIVKSNGVVPSDDDGPRGSSNE